MSSRKQTHARITPLNPPEPMGRRKQRELAGERPVADQAAYVDRSEVDAAEPLTDTAFDEGELPAGAVEAPLDAADLSDGEELGLLADLADGVQPVSVDAELPEIENLELLADIYEGQLPARVEEGLVRDTAGLDLLTDLELRAGETADPLIASDEGATYVPPCDPPVIPAPPAHPPTP